MDLGEEWVADRGFDATALSSDDNGVPPTVMWSVVVA